MMMMEETRVAVRTVGDGSLLLLCMNDNGSLQMISTIHQPLNLHSSTCIYMEWNLLIHMELWNYFELLCFELPTFTNSIILELWNLPNSVNSIPNPLNTSPPHPRLTHTTCRSITPVSDSAFSQLANISDLELLETGVVGKLKFSRCSTGRMLGGSHR